MNRNDILPLYYPKGTNKGILYSDGPILSGMVNGNLKMSGSLYTGVFQPGPNMNGMKADSLNPECRIFKIRKDWNDLVNPGEKSQYQSDYENWPINFGAPFETGNNGKKYPKYIGDMQAWWVMNDLTDSIKQLLYSTPAIGTEWQCQLWAFNLPGALAHSIFKKFKIINKSNQNLSDCYFSFWSDPDIGNGADDYSGCDTSFSLGYCYNAVNVDQIYGKEVPAFGYVLL